MGKERDDGKEASDPREAAESCKNEPSALSLAFASKGCLQRIGDTLLLVPKVDNCDVFASYGIAPLIAL
jgi:hypothetical protein